MDEFESSLRSNSQLSRLEDEEFDGSYDFVMFGHQIIKYGLGFTILEFKNFPAMVDYPGVARFEVGRIECAHDLFVLDPAADLMCAVLGEIGFQAVGRTARVGANRGNGLDVLDELVDLINRVRNRHPAFLGSEGIEIAENNFLRVHL